MVVVGERLVGAQRLLKVRYGKARIRGYESAGSVHRFQNHLAAAATAHAEAQHAKQVVGDRRFAGGYLNHLIRTCQLVQLAGLRKVAVNKFEKLGLFQFLGAA